MKVPQGFDIHGRDDVGANSENLREFDEARSQRGDDSGQLARALAMNSSERIVPALPGSIVAGLVERQERNGKSRYQTTRMRRIMGTP